MLTLPIQTLSSGLKTMNSLDLAYLCVGQSKDAHSDFIKKAKKVLGEGLGNFSDTYTTVQNKELTCYNLPEREACLMAMSYSYDLQAFVYDEWQKLKGNAEPKWLVELSPEAKIAIADLSKQRDEAIKTKAQINDKRTATLMNKASQDSKRIKKLEAKLQDEGQYTSLLAAGLPQRVDTELKDNVQTFRILKNISSDLELPPRKVDDQRYGQVNTYHVDVIKQFKAEYL
jgi:hypothetical protein